MWPFRTYVGLIEVVQALTVEAGFFLAGAIARFFTQEDNRSSTNLDTFASNTRKIAVQTAITTGLGPPIVH